MSFAVPADAYDRFMGRYSRPLAAQFADFTGVEKGQRLLDVGCGPGALTAELARRVGVDRIAAADPAPGFAQACAARIPGVDVRTAGAEELPWPSASFDGVLAQLVLSFLGDADAGVGEMRRVARPGAILAACTWDQSDQMQMLQIFWDAALAIDPAAPDEARVLPYTDPVSLRELWSRAGLRQIESAPLVVEVEYADFDDYWQPFLTGTGPPGAYCASLGLPQQTAIREECRRRLGDPDGPFTLSARALAVRGRL